MLRGPYAIVGPRGGNTNRKHSHLAQAREAITDTQDVIVFGGSKAVRRLQAARKRGAGKRYGHELDFTGIIE